MTILITARTGSTRIPNKILKPLGDRSMLEQIIHRAKKVEGVKDIVISTTVHKKDDTIEQVCDLTGVQCFRGAEIDIYQRHLDTFKAFDIEAALHWSSDSPFIPLEILNRGSEVYHANKGHDFYRLSESWLGGGGGRKYSIISRSFLEKVKPILDIYPMWRNSYWQYYGFCHFDPNQRISLVYDQTIEKSLFDIFIIPAEDLWQSLSFNKLRLKLSIDWPLELALHNEICKYLGHFPEGPKDFIKAMEGIHSFKSSGFS